ncbi:MAG TPA: hypothetical protein VNL74_05125 [Methylococcus sp.]|nr:hypothetical protein [Methylococcus sp.]
MGHILRCLWFLPRLGYDAPKPKRKQWKVGNTPDRKGVPEVVATAGKSRLAQNFPGHTGRRRYRPGATEKYF